MEMMVPSPIRAAEKAGSLAITPDPLTLAGQRLLASDLQAGESLQSFLSRHVDGLNEGWVVSIEGAEVPGIMWARTYPKHGMIIECRRVLRGDILKLAAVVAISYFTMGLGGLGTGGLFTAGGAIGGGFWAAASVFVVGNILVNQMLGPKQADASQLSAAAAGVSPTYSISGGNNTERPYEPIGIVFGQLRVTPDFSSKPYSWFAGDDQYLYEVLHGGVNCGSVSDIRIGDTPLSSYTDVALQTDGFTSMPQVPLLNWSNVDTVAGALLVGGPDLGDPSDFTPGPWVTRTTSTDTAAIQVDFNGSVYKVNDSGGFDTRPCILDGQYRLLPSGDWVQLWQTVLSGTSTAPLRTTYTISTPVVGQYEVRFRKATRDIAATNEANSMSWESLKSVQADSAITPASGASASKSRQAASYRARWTRSAGWRQLRRSLSGPDPGGSRRRRLRMACQTLARTFISICAAITARTAGSSLAWACRMK